jgi:hypothetical protein
MTNTCVIIFAEIYTERQGDMIEGRQTMAEVAEIQPPPDELVAPINNGKLSVRREDLK